MPNLFGIGQILNKSRVANGAQVGLLGTREGALYTCDWITMLALEGKCFAGPHTTGNQTYITGQTSFANTTPTFLLDIPTGVTAIPLGASLAQAGTVAGGTISIYIETDIIKRYSSGGSVETTQNRRSDQAAALASGCVLYTGATAAAGYGVRHFGAIGITQTVTVETAQTDFKWVPQAPLILVGPAAWLIFTVAGTTGPTWAWSMSWAELPSSALT